MSTPYNQYVDNYYLYGTCGVLRCTARCTVVYRGVRRCTAVYAGVRTTAAVYYVYTIV